MSTKVLLADAGGPTLDARALYRAPSGRLCMWEPQRNLLSDVAFCYVRMDARGCATERLEGFSLSTANLRLLRRVY